GFSRAGALGSSTFTSPPPARSRFLSALDETRPGVRAPPRQVSGSFRGERDRSHRRQIRFRRRSSRCAAAHHYSRRILSFQRFARATRERSEEHTSELQSPDHLVCRLLLEKKKKEV